MTRKPIVTSNRFRISSDTHKKRHTERLIEAPSSPVVASSCLDPSDCAAGSLNLGLRAAADPVEPDLQWDFHFAPAQQDDRSPHVGHEAGAAERLRRDFRLGREPFQVLQVDLGPLLTKWVGETALHRKAAEERQVAALAV